MPISEDEYEVQSSHGSSNMSKAELRKTHKPIMEKRRRARINQCLNEIKSLILEAMNKDPARHSKLEKADILEMAVKHLQNVQRQQLAFAVASDPSVLRKFKSGFSECANDINRFVAQSDGIDNGLKDRMRSHLQKCINGIEQVAQFNLAGCANIPFAGSQNSFEQSPSSNENSGDKNNNGRLIIPTSIQLIPSRLPSGEIALLVPNSSNLPFLPNLITQRDRPSAFAAVIPSTTTTNSSLNLLNSPNSRLQPPQLPKQFLDQVPSTYTSSSKIEPKPGSLIVRSFNNKKNPPSPKKLFEPLCVITNQSERYKQAQTREDGMNFEENTIKQEFSEDPQEMLITASNSEFLKPVPKKIKIESTSSASTSSTQEPPECNNDMWRPW